MYCVECGLQNDDDAAFCVHCGAPLGGVPHNQTAQVPKVPQGTPVQGAVAPSRPVDSSAAKRGFGWLPVTIVGLLCVAAIAAVLVMVFSRPSSQETAEPSAAEASTTVSAQDAETEDSKKSDAEEGAAALDTSDAAEPAEKSDSATSSAADAAAPTEESDSATGSAADAAKPDSAADSTPKTPEAAPVEAPAAAPKPEPEPEPQPEPEPEPAPAGQYPPQFGSVDASSEQSAAGYASSSYSPWMARDNNKETVWIEGVDGPGYNQWICLYASSPQLVSGVRVVGGFPKNTEVYYANYRPREVTIELSDGYTKSYTLNDVYGEWQNIVFDGQHATTYVRLVINSVYDTYYWTDTCIAEFDVY